RFSRDWSSDVCSSDLSIQLIGLKHINLKKASEEIRKKFQKENAPVQISSEEIQENLEMLDEVRFSHLHNHSQFSVLQSTISVQRSEERRVGRESTSGC